MKFNTAIATLMALVNDFYANGASRGDMKALLLMLSPFAPHMCEELWEMAGYGGQVSQQSWPVYDESKTVTATTQMAVQVSRQHQLSQPQKVLLPIDELYNE